VERSGAAQGLAEVLAVLGRTHMEALLPDILAACSSSSAFVREGNLTLFNFLPHAIPDVFQVWHTLELASEASLSKQQVLVSVRWRLAGEGPMVMYCILLDLKDQMTANLAA
jgi:hypothetical protein